MLELSFRNKLDFMKIAKYKISLIIFAIFFTSSITVPVLQIFSIYLSWIPIEFVTSLISINSMDLFIIFSIGCNLYFVYLYKNMESSNRRIFSGFLFACFFTGSLITYFQRFGLPFTSSSFTYAFISLILLVVLLIVDFIRHKEWYSNLF